MEVHTDICLHIGRTGIISHTWAARNCTDMENTSRMDLGHSRRMDPNMDRDMDLDMDLDHNRHTDQGHARRTDGCVLSTSL